MLDLTPFQLRKAWIVLSMMRGARFVNKLVGLVAEFQLGRNKL